MDNRVYKISGIISTIIVLVFSCYVINYAYTNEMWYELFISLCGGVLMLYCSYLLYTLTNEKINEMCDND